MRWEALAVLGALVWVLREAMWLLLEMMRVVLWEAMLVLWEVMSGALGGDGDALLRDVGTLRGEKMKAAGPRRKPSSIQLHSSGAASLGNSRHTAPGGRYV